MKKEGKKIPKVLEQNWYHFSRVLMLYSQDSDSGVGILGLLGMELIFFIAVHMVLCFRLVTKTVLFNTAMF